MEMKYFLFIFLFLTGCGSAGPSGQQGMNGANGANGEDGSSCHVTEVFANAQAPNGGALLICGPDSALLLNGIPGKDGTDGTVINSVQLCPSNFVPTYPDIFPEIAFKIENKLYAVYSANGGFLVELVPGTYSSNGINASCTFTVSADGSVN